MEGSRQEFWIGWEGEPSLWERVARAAKQNLTSAPDALIEQTVGQLPPARRAVLALGRTSLATLGLRGEPAETFQCAFGDETASVRLEFSPIPDGWSVLGRVEPPEAAVIGPAGDLSTDPEGRFSFEAPTLERVELAIVVEDGILELPPLPEALGFSE